jgi:hypothetical protein
LPRRAPYVLALFTTLGVAHAALSGSCGSDGPNHAGDGGAGGGPVDPPIYAQCLEDFQCALDSPCTTVQCLRGKCVYAAAPDGPAPALPDDDNDCTIATCVSGRASSVNAPSGAPCAAGTCNDLGQCTGCTEASQCSGSDSFCRQRTCENSICGFLDAEIGTPLPEGNQAPGDCKRRVCDGDGDVIEEDDASDLPDARGACSRPACDDGEPRQRPIRAGADCAEGRVCDGTGRCVECVDDDGCTPPETCGAELPNKCGCVEQTDNFEACRGRCGRIFGNCGQTVDCGGCLAPGLCYEGACCVPTSKAIVCSDAECGSVIDNCGQTVDCGGGCSPPNTCGGGGVDNQCGCTDDGSACSGRDCGTVTNNCGQTVTCQPNACSSPTTCGGGGVRNVCGCTDDGAACEGKNCGTVTNNCGVTVTCEPNACASPTTCGGGGVANVCGGGS